MLHKMDGRDKQSTQMQDAQLKRGRMDIMQIIFLPLSLIFFEAAFHLFSFRGMDGTIIYPILFAAAIGLAGAFFTSIFPEKVNKTLTAVILFLCGLWYSTQLIYHDIFKTFLSIYSIGANGADAMEFYEQALKAVGARAAAVLIFFLPFILALVLIKKRWMQMPKRKLPVLIGEAACGILLYLLALLVLIIPGKEAHTPYDLYHKNFLMDLSMEKLGVLASTRRDIMQIITGGANNDLDDIIFMELPTDAPSPTAALASAFTPTPAPVLTQTAQNEREPSGTPVPTPAPTLTPTPAPTPIDTSPNVLDIDFGVLAEKEENSTIKKLHSYFANSVPTNKNEYTGMFKGYNLIMLTAEGYSKWAVNKEITPTLYKMVHEGFYFENYYTPLWWTSTSDGEFVECTGLIPTGTNSFAKTAEHNMPFGLGWIFQKLGYSARAYHNHTYTYYHRDQTHPNMGYDYKGAKGGGLEVKLTWPESDLEMMQVTIPEYIGEEPFHTYYMTVSGHMDYNFTGNSMSAKNREYVEDLDLSLEAKAYLACQKELDFAMEYLLEQLEEAGVADRTVIVLSGDHYPYGLEKDKLDNLAGHEVEENFELYESHLILYCPGMEPVTVSKPCSALDIIPTILNLFGVEYDARLFMGQDIFSAASALVMFSNQSYITDKVMYNSKTGEVTKLVEEELPEDYVKTVSSIVRNKFSISAAIITNDYYSYLKPYLE